MLRFRYLLSSLLVILLIAACSSETEDLAPYEAIFGLSVDPVSQTVTLDEVSAASLNPQQTSDAPRVLTSEELQVEAFTFAFLPGNILSVNASFKNVSNLNFEQPFTFSVAPGTSNIVASTEPVVNDADLGGDGVLKPGEVTSLLTFQVEHNNAPFDYFVNASAVVTAGEPQIGCDEPETEVSIPDEVLRDGIRVEIGITEAAITCRDMLRLTRLDFEISDVVSSLEGLQYATNLISLSIRTFNFTDLSHLTGLTKLTTLSLPYGDIVNISPLDDLIELTTLDLYSNQISDISPLANLTALQDLNLGDNRISDISPLANLTALQDLRLGLNSIPDLSPLTNLSKLTHLNLYSSRISDISPLANLTALQELHLRTNIISDLSPLANLTNLQNLGLSDNPVFADLSPLASLTNLQNLSLNRGVSDLRPLANTTKLKYLSAPGGSISDLSPLANTTDLLVLNLRDNLISDLSPLANLGIRTLYLSDNLISDVSPLASLANIRSLDLGFNDISDITALVASSGLDEGDSLDLIYNCLDRSEGSDDLTNIRTLRSRGVYVTVGNRDIEQRYCTP